MRALPYAQPMDITCVLFSLLLKCYSRESKMEHFSSGRENHISMDANSQTSLCCTSLTAIEKNTLLKLL